MPVTVSCPLCNNDLEVDRVYLGRKVMCPYCQKMFVPPLPQAGLGVASLFLGMAAGLIELFILVYFLTGGNWEASILTARRIHGLMVFVRFVGLVMSWVGIACGVFAYTQKRRLKTAAQWGVIVNVALTIFVCGYMGIKSLTPEEPVETEDDEESTSWIWRPNDSPRPESLRIEPNSYPAAPGDERFAEDNGVMKPFHQTSHSRIEQPWQSAFWPG